MHGFTNDQNNPHYYKSVPSNLLTGGPTSQTTTSTQGRTVWWWSGMRRASGTTCRATTTCRSPARKAQVSMALWGSVWECWQYAPTFFGLVMENIYYADQDRIGLKMNLNKNTSLNCDSANSIVWRTARSWECQHVRGQEGVLPGQLHRPLPVQHRLQTATLPGGTLQAWRAVGEATGSMYCWWVHTHKHTHRNCT